MDGSDRRVWDEARARLREMEPGFYELEPGGALALDLGGDGWLLEIGPDGRLACQLGMDMDDIMLLLSDGTPEGLGVDELAKQAKYYLQPAVAKFRRAFLNAGFEEKTEMTELYVAATFHKAVDLGRIEEVAHAVRWCRAQIA